MASVIQPIIDLVMEIANMIPDNPTVLILPLLSLFGAGVLMVKAFTFIWLLVDIYVLPGIPLSHFGLRGSWAVVTGASDGIGREFALQVARRGYNVVLVSRTQTKVAAVAAMIAAKYPSVRTKPVVMDLANASEEDWGRLARATEVLDVAILINNVGVSHEYPVPFIKTKLDEMQNIINLNCHATLRVTQMIAPHMVDRRRGLILTMVSFAGVFPSPLLATYAASKSFLTTWSTALGAELAPYGITVNCVQSHMVVSNMSKIRNPNILVPPPRLFVRDVLTKIGRGCGSQGIPYNSTPYWTHAMLQWSLESVLGRWNPVLLWFNKAMQESVRYRALKKIESQKKSS